MESDAETAQASMGTAEAACRGVRGCSEPSTCGRAPLLYEPQLLEPVDRAPVDPVPGSHGEWRRLGYAIAFFCACLAVMVTLFAIGFYH